MKRLRKFTTSEILFVIPSLIYMLIFVGYPIVYNIILSFQDTTLTNIGSASKKFVWLANYKNLFSSNLIFITINRILKAICYRFAPNNDFRALLMCSICFQIFLSKHHVQQKQFSPI